MVDNMYSVKEASKLLDCTTQNIYRQKNELISKGYMEQSGTDTYYLNEKGINYLREKRIETIKSNNQDFSQVDNNNLTSDLNRGQVIDNTVIVDLLKEQIQELKQEKEYWKKEYEKKDQELAKTNEYLQNINTTFFQRLLATEEQNKKQSEETKKGFWKKIFG